MRYNVKILGYSIGTTDSYTQALEWYHFSQKRPWDKEICIMSVRRT